jgi:3-oxoacyl-[acyl-carrier protein] reductase
VNTVAASLQGKVAWVTGSSRGIGREVATYLGRLGASVVLHGTTPTSIRAFGEGTTLDRAAAEVAAASGAEVLAVHGDVTKAEEVERMVGEIHARFGRIDILVNNAGGDIGAAGATSPTGGKPERNDAVFIPLPDLHAILDRNLLSVILVCRAVVPEMIERRRGWIVNIGSVAAHEGRPFGVMYATAKAGMTAYSRCLAAQLREYNIPVNVIAPGMIVTPRAEATGQLDPAKRDAQDTLIRHGRPEEVARAVAFLVADPGAYVSGQVLRVDGGTQLWPA